MIFRYLLRKKRLFFHSYAWKSRFIVIWGGGRVVDKSSKVKRPPYPGTFIIFSSLLHLDRSYWPLTGSDIVSSPQIKWLSIRFSKSMTTNHSLHWACTTGISHFSVCAKTHRKIRIPSKKYFSDSVPSEKYTRKYNDRKIQLFYVFAVRNNFSVGVKRTEKLR